MITPAHNKTPIAIHKPRLEERAGGGTNPAGEGSAAAAIAGAGAIGTVGIADGERGCAGGGTGTRTAACVVAGGLAMRPMAPAPGASVPISVSSGETGARGVVANVVPGLGSAETGTLFSALAKASALWKRSAGSLAMAIRMISLSAGGTSARRLIGEGGCWFNWAVIKEYCESPWNGSLPVRSS